MNCFFNDQDDAVAPTTWSNYNTKSLTAAIVWNGIAPVADGGTIDTPELKTILQEVIDRGGWVSGQAVMILIKDNSSDNGAYRAFSAIDYLLGAEKAELHVYL